MDKFLELQNNPMEGLDDDESTPFDKLREECGVMAVYNHPDAARLTYWGLYALQHRGQESAGIVTSDGLTSRVHKAMGSIPHDTRIEEGWGTLLARIRSAVAKKRGDKR